jgi:hypothetical protein
MGDLRNRGWKDKAWLLLSAGAVVAVFAGFVAYMTRLQGGAAELQEANPTWKVTSRGYTPIGLDDGSAAGELLIGGDDSGPFHVERIGCDEVRRVFPSWFELPDAPIGNCGRLGNAPPYTLVLNLRTTTPVPELWDRLYEPTVTRLKLDYGGGWSGPASGSANTGRRASAMYYSVDPAASSGDRKVAIEARWVDGTTTAIFTFRPASSP